MRIHKAYPIDGHPVLGTFGARSLAELEAVADAGMNLIVGGSGALDPETPEGTFCLDHGIKVMHSIAGHVHGRPRLSLPIGEGETTIPIADGQALPGPSTVKIDEELIQYKRATPNALVDCVRGFGGSLPGAHELSTVLFWPQPLASEIARVKDSPNLWGYWALDDSPGYALSAMRALYHTVTQTAGDDHPVVGGYSGATTLRNFGPGTCDMITFYFYPFLREGYERTMNSLDTQWILTDARRRVPGIPFIGVSQGFWEGEGSTRRVNKEGALTPRQIREQCEDFVREGASGLLVYAALGADAGEFKGWDSDEAVSHELARICDEARRTGGLEVPPEPEELAVRRIQPQGFYRHSSEVPGMVPAWNIIGPFDASSDPSLDAVFPPDEGVHLGAEYPGKGIRASWREYPAYAATIGFVEIYGHVDYVKECMAYAACTVTSPEARAAQIRFGSDDDALVRLAGEEVWRHDGFRGVHLDSDIVPVELPKGDAEIVVKIYNREGQWGFFLRFTDEDGRPLKGLQFSPP
jgi:hypothetical protein